LLEFTNIKRQSTLFKFHVLMVIKLLRMIFVLVL